jgi:hypothetical protein
MDFGIRTRSSCFGLGLACRGLLSSYLTDTGLHKLALKSKGNQHTYIKALASPSRESGRGSPISSSMGICWACSLVNKTSIFALGCYHCLKGMTCRTLTSIPWKAPSLETNSPSPYFKSSQRSIEPQSCVVADTSLLRPIGLEDTPPRCEFFTTSKLLLDFMLFFKYSSSIILHSPMGLPALQIFSSIIFNISLIRVASAALSRFDLM